MNSYINGEAIRMLRDKKKMTQAELAEKIGVTDKAVSKWETGRGLPDITLVEPLAETLGVSVIELFSGRDVTNTNKASNMLRTNFYVCPVCGNVIHSTGEAVVSCCGITLPPLEAEPANDSHFVRIERVEDEFFITIAHEMSKNHYISFVAALQNDGVEIRKLYPEGNPEARFKIRGTRGLYYYCNRHGLFRASI